MGTAGTMEASTVCLMLLVMSGYCYVLQPSLNVTEVGVLESTRDSWSESYGQRLWESLLSQGDTGNERAGKQTATIYTADKNKQETERTEQGLTPETGRERGIIYNERMSEERPDVGGLTPETGLGKDGVMQGTTGGESELTVGLTESTGTGETLDVDQGGEKTRIEEGPAETTSENRISGGEESRGEGDLTSDKAEDGLIGGSSNKNGREDEMRPDTISEKTAGESEVAHIDEQIKGTLDGPTPSVDTEIIDRQTDANSDALQAERQRLEKEELERKLVAGIGLHKGTMEREELENEGMRKEQRRGERGREEEGVESATENKDENVKGEEDAGEVAVTELEETGDEDHTFVTELTPLMGSEFSPGPSRATLRHGSLSELLASTPSSVRINHEVLPPPPMNLPRVPTKSPDHVPPTSFNVSGPSHPHLDIDTLPAPVPTNQIRASGTEEKRFVSLVEDELTEVQNINSSTRYTKEDFVFKPLEVKVGPTAKMSVHSGKEDVNVKHKGAKPTANELEAINLMTEQSLLPNQEVTNSAAQPPRKITKEEKTTSSSLTKEANITTQQQTTATSTVKNGKFTTQNQKTTPKPKPATDQSQHTKAAKQASNSPAKLVKPTPPYKVPRTTDKPKHSVSTENETRPAVKYSKSKTPESQETKSTTKPELTPPTATTAAAEKPGKVNKSHKNKKSKKREKAKGTKGKKSNRTTTTPVKKKEEVTSPAYFPYFKDNYCPPECACYGRVIQCSDKGVDKFPYGVPYNARYILLMNNQIDGIQLDLLKEYLSMEFLVLSNNLLTDGAIEGAFEGVPALKRLYLDQNLLESVPTDLPPSLEELRLDNNRLHVMSEAAWACCPGLLVLSLSNNSLGNGSESLPTGVLSSLANLRTLNLDYNHLASVPLGLPLSIRELYLRGNLIQRFRGRAFIGKSELVVLDLSANRLTNKGLLRDSLLNATHLESLNLEGNKLKQVPRHLPPSLKTLNLEGNLISAISKAAFHSLPHLEHLGLARNKISRVAPGAFRTLSVLHQLDLCHNALHQVPRQLPRALHSAALTHNRIQSVPRDAFCWGNATTRLSSLVRVQLEHNLIDLGHLDAQAFRCLRGFQVVHFY